MFRFLAALLLLVASVATGDDATIFGNKEVVAAPGYWGQGIGRTLYITESGYLRDSLGTKVPVDTTRNSVGSFGACTDAITMRTLSGAVPGSHISVQYAARSTNTSSSAMRMYIATRWRVPSGVDTNWVLVNYVYGDSIIPYTHNRASLPASQRPVRVNFYAEGQDLRVCFAAAESGGPVGSDTVVITNVWARGW